MDYIITNNVKVSKEKAVDGGQWTVDRKEILDGKAAIFDGASVS